MKQSTIVSGGPAAALREGKTRRKKGELHHKRMRNGTNARRRAPLIGLLGDGERANHSGDRLRNTCSRGRRFTGRLASQMRGCKYSRASKNRCWKRRRGRSGSSLTRTVVNVSLVHRARTGQPSESCSAKTKQPDDDNDPSAPNPSAIPTRRSLKIPLCLPSCPVPPRRKAFHLLCEFNAL